MKPKLFILIYFILFLAPFFISAKSFVVKQPSNDEVIEAVLVASRQTRVRSALLFGVFGMETGFGTDLGKTASQWKSLCERRNSSHCQNWKKKDCRSDNTNARNFDTLLKKLGFVDTTGNADRTEIPTSSTCALGFTQFEPATWHLMVGQKDKVYNPWSIKDSLLVAALYLEDIGVDNRQILGPGEVLGPKDREAIQKYYCGSDYQRPDCVDYAKGVEKRARNAFEIFLKTDLERQLEILREELLRSGVEITDCPVIDTADFGFGVAPDEKLSKIAATNLANTTTELISVLKRYQRLKDNELLVQIQEFAQKRKKHLVETIYRDSDSALFSVLLEGDRLELSKLTRKCIEAESTAEGILEVLSIDFEDGLTQSQFTLFTDDGKSVVLHPARGLHLSPESGIRVKVKGIRVDNEMIFNGSRSLSDKNLDFSGGIGIVSQP